MKDLYQISNRFFSTFSKSTEGRHASKIRFQVQFKIDGRNVFWLRRDGDHIRTSKAIRRMAELIFETDLQSYIAMLNSQTTPTDLWFDGKLKLPGFGLHRAGYAHLLSTIRVCQGRYFWKN